jgi:excinuclease UvrABC nuclease subunit
VNIDLRSLRASAVQRLGNVSGVYFLFDGDELVYIGQGWNCLLRVAEHTRKDSDKKFTHWNFVEIQSEAERKDIEQELRRAHSPKYNRI